MFCSPETDMRQTHHGNDSNRLAQETSPYLRQHAQNPVDWFPWGPEALERARQLDRPIFLSIGYSACHWCHVMEHESFEDEEVAGILNENFVSIKVDREERPDLDQIYMNSVQLLTGQGGWPMSVFLTPELRPFFGGTYFPPDDRYGRPGFKRLLRWLAGLWEQERDKVNQQASEVTEHLQGALRLEASDGQLDVEVLRKGVAQLGRRFDPLHGGFGPAPKFLHTMDLRLLLRAWRRFDLPDALHMVRHTLTRMAVGGLYDQLGGGFARYSTDPRWLVPHFEKMLYDNALLVGAYLEAYQATGDPLFRTVIEETLAWVEREMTSPEGSFYSTLDADSDGEEGKFYVWTQKEIEDVLGKDQADLFNAFYGVEPEGNWDDPHDAEHLPKNILHWSKTHEQFARLYKIDEGELRRRLNESRATLLQVRNRRIWPGRDDKVLTSWNALMIAALAEAAAVLDQHEYASRATRAADFILTTMRGSDGRLFRTSSTGSSPRLNAYLEDYAYLIDALVSLYEATFNPRWIEAAQDLAGVMIDQFWDPEEGGFFFTGRDHEALIARNKDPYDNAIPSGNALAVTGLLRLAKLTGRTDLRQKAEQTLDLFRGLMNTSPAAVAQMLIAYDFHLGPVQEFAVVGDLGAEPSRRVLRAIRGHFRPHKVVAGKDDTIPEAPRVVPLLAGKEARDGVTTYICENFACQAPLLGPEAVEHALAEKRGMSDEGGEKEGTINERG
jgi:uncharacterized protein